MGWMQSLIAVCIGLLALIVGAVWYFLGRSQMKISLPSATKNPLLAWFKSPTMRWRKAAPDKGSDNILGSLRADYPAAEEEGQFDRLTKDDSRAEAALADLQSFARVKSRPKRGTSSSLQLSAAAGPNDRQVKAALVTLFRTIYSNPQLVDSLGDDGEESLDAFLASLTD